MIKVNNIEVGGINNAIRGMRYAMNSDHLADSAYWIYSHDGEYQDAVNEIANLYFKSTDIDNLNDLLEEKREWLYNNSEIVFGRNYSANFLLGPNDLRLAQTLISAGDGSHRKFLRQISISMDITASLLWWKQMDQYRVGVTTNSQSTMHTAHKRDFTLDDFSFMGANVGELKSIIDKMNFHRRLFVETKDTVHWRAMIELMPSSFVQKRMWSANYETLRAIYMNRRGHKLEEWRMFCDIIESLPYAKELITYKKGRITNE